MLLHVDADCFFVSVERRHRRGLHDRPVAVAGEVVACASYEARACGVRGGMPTRTAMRRCPALVVVPFRDDGYETAGRELMDLLREHTRWVEPASVEEAFLGFDDDSDRVAHAIAVRSDTWRRLALPVSVGVGRTKLIAKLASRRAKPNGLVHADLETERRVRAVLHFEDVWGVGPTSLERLKEAGLHAVTDLAGHDEESLTPVVSRGMARKLLAIAAGADDATIRLPRERRSASSQRTLSPPTRSRSLVLRTLHDCANAVAIRLAADPRLPSSAGLSVRFDDLTEAHQHLRWNRSTITADDLAEAGAHLLDRAGYLDDGRGLGRVALRVALPDIPNTARAATSDVLPPRR